MSIPRSSEILPAQSTTHNRTELSPAQVERLFAIVAAHERGESPSAEDLDCLVAWFCAGRA